MSVKSPTVNASGKRSRPSLNIIHSLTRPAVRTWSTVTRLRTHNSTVPRTELQQSKCFTEHEYRCAQRSILRPTGELKRPYITPYRAIELTICISHTIQHIDELKSRTVKCQNFLRSCLCSQFWCISCMTSALYFVGKRWRQFRVHYTQQLKTVNCR